MAPCVNLPVGFKFRPRDDELLGYYLLNKVRGSSFMFDNVIPEFDLYGNIEPWDIWNEYGGNKLENGEDLYFFTKLKSLSNKDARVARTIGSGTWKGQNSGKNVPDPRIEDNDLGMWKRLHYENPKSDQNGCWIMHEYSLYPSMVKPKPNSTSDAHQFVLCRIRKNDMRKRKSSAANEIDDTPSVQSQHKKQKQQVTSFDELIGNCTPRSQAIGGVGVSVSYLLNGPTQSKPDCSFAYPITMVDDVIQFHGGGGCSDALMGGFSPLNTTQSFTEQAALGSYAVYNEERRTCIEFDESHATRQGLTDNNIGAALTKETDCQFDSENAQPNNVKLLDFPIDYDLLHHLIQVDGGVTQQSAASSEANYDISQFLDADDVDAFMKDVSILDTTATTYGDNVQPLAAQPLGSHPYLSIHQSAVNDEERPAYVPSSQSLTTHDSDNTNIEFGMSEDQTGAQLGVGTENAQVNASEFPVHDEDMLDFLNSASFDQLVDMIQFHDNDDDEVQAITTESSVMGMESTTTATTSEM